MKLLYFSQSYTPHDFRFLKAFADSGIQTYYLRLTNQVLESRPVPKGVTAVPWIGDSTPYCPGKDEAERLTALRGLLEELRPDLVLAGPVFSCTRLISKSGFQPFVAMSWGSDLLVDAAPGTEGETMAKSFLSKASAGFGDCRQVQDAFLRLTELPEQRIAVFPWGIDVNEFRPDVEDASYRSWPGWESSQVIISLRSWEPIYAVDTLVEAFAEVHRVRPAARLLLAGDGSEHSKIINLIQKYDLTDVVATPGRILNTELPSWLASSNLYVSSALSDGSSISLLEAMGCGCPVVVINAYGNLEWVEEGLNGWLAPPGNPVALASVILNGLDLPEKESREMGVRNRDKVEKYADWKKNISKLTELFFEIT